MKTAHGLAISPTKRNGLFDSCVIIPTLLQPSLHWPSPASRATLVIAGLVGQKAYRHPMNQKSSLMSMHGNLCQTGDTIASSSPVVSPWPVTLIRTSTFFAVPRLEIENRESVSAF